MADAKLGKVTDYLIPELRDLCEKTSSEDWVKEGNTFIRPMDWKLAQRIVLTDNYEFKWKVTPFPNGAIFIVLSDDSQQTLINIEVKNYQEHLWIKHNLGKYGDCMWDFDVDWKHVDKQIQRIYTGYRKKPE